MPNSKLIECVFQIPVVVASEGDSSSIFLVLIHRNCFLVMCMELNHGVQMPLDQICI